MYFTPQQLCGGHKYNQKTRIGNWWEDQEKVETGTKDYMNTKNSGALKVDAVQKTKAISTQKVRTNLKNDNVFLGKSYFQRRWKSSLG